MKQNVKTKLDIANKLIFVQEYESAKDILIEIISSQEGCDQLLVHLRLSELAVRLDRVEEFMLFYGELKESQIFSERTYDFAIAFLKQHSELVTMEDSIDLFIELLDKYPNEPAGFYSIGFALEYLSRWDRAISNYEKALAVDSEWYPCYFGLSQIYYSMNQDTKGDHFFYLYEQQAPYNLYGNFDTHRRLTSEFIENEQYEFAEKSVETLVEWWEDNKGVCPKEIKVFEIYTKSRIKDTFGDQTKADAYRNSGGRLVTEIIRTPSFDTGALYFVAKVLEEHAEFDLAFKVYRVILKKDNVDPTMIQKIGSQFLSLGQSDLAYKLFDEAYQANPGSREISFGRLVSNLRLHEVDVEQYLASREKMSRINSDQGDRVEKFSLLHNMLAQFDEDADVHLEISTLYESMGNGDRAQIHIERALELDGINPKVRMEAANFFLHSGHYEKAMSTINQISHSNLLDTDQLEEYQFIQATIYMQLGEFETATNFLAKLLVSDPWSVTYLVQMLYSKMMRICEDKGEYDDPAVESLLAGGDGNLDWTKFDKITHELQSLHETELVYLRSKLRFLYSKNDHYQVINLVQAAVQWNPIVAGNEIIRLLNTNFDSAEIYFALSTLYAEQWQLKVSSMWAEQALLHPDIDDSVKKRVYLRLADNYLWDGDKIEKALQYATIAHDIGAATDESANRIIGHAYLKKGNSKEAGLFLEQSSDLSIESSYLKGLLEYRNGAVEKANRIWKPLLTQKTMTVKEHHIKQELLKFYFDDAPYLKVN